ncbi:cyclic nucleotide-binding domain-containing protein [Brucepastera parasyntrophica]|uniref:cyclic nucleotide-binding domain-containing protein n=1 Tax=Brucepastera parasyntrophica TaxID=2880008 RepID=UPI00210A6952|nr:cyclic nucleotide-binding domain-containing protein [Brucepastera parasyntrophica]ULQ60198.1 cyclic nucleotide-binding domain-containing protein [Brucepastera parasyntrophica]
MEKVGMFPDVFLANLVEVPMFSRIEKTDLIAIGDICDMYSFDPGEVLIEEDSMVRALYTLVSGEVDVLKKGEQKKEIKLSTLTSGAVFGETSLFKNRSSTATVRAKTQALIMSLSREKFSVYINAHPKAGLIILTYIIMGLIDKLDASNEVIAYEKESAVSEEDFEILKDFFPLIMEDIMPE